MGNISCYIQDGVLIENMNMVKATVVEAAELKLILDEHIEFGWKNIIIDMTNCMFVDSSFWGVMVLALKKINRIGGRLVLVVPENFGDELFKVSGILKVLSFYSTITTALESFVKNSTIEASQGIFNSPIKYAHEISY